MKRTCLAGLAIIALMPWMDTGAALGQTAKSINVGDVKDHAPPPGPAPFSRLGDEVEIAHPRSKTSE